MIMRCVVVQNDMHAHTTHITTHTTTTHTHTGHTTHTHTTTTTTTHTHYHPPVVICREELTETLKGGLVPLSYEPPCLTESEDGATL